MHVDLDQLERELESQLKLHPLYKRLEAVRLLKQDYQRVSPVVADNSTAAPLLVQENGSNSLIPEQNHSLTTPEQREKITLASVEVLKQNPSLTTKELFRLLLMKGIYVPGKKPSTTLAAILYGKSSYVERDEQGNWKAV